MSPDRTFASWISHRINTLRSYSKAIEPARVLRKLDFMSHRPKLCRNTLKPGALFKLNHR